MLKLVRYPNEERDTRILICTRKQVWLIQTKTTFLLGMDMPMLMLMFIRHHSPPRQCLDGKTCPQ